jgi:hypothetical protein
MFDVTEFELDKYYEVTIIYSCRVNTLFLFMFTFPSESILTGVLDDEYVIPDELLSW